MKLIDMRKKTVLKIYISFLVISFFAYAVIPFILECLYGNQDINLIETFSFDMTLVYSFFICYLLSFYLIFKAENFQNFKWKYMFIHLGVQLICLILNQVFLFLYKNVLSITAWNNLSARMLMFLTTTVFIIVISLLVLLIKSRKESK